MPRPGPKERGPAAGTPQPFAVSPRMNNYHLSASVVVFTNEGVVMKKAVVIVAASLAGGVGLGVGQGLVGGGGALGIGPLAWAQDSAEAVRRSAEERSIIRVARQARPAVVSVSTGRGGGSGVIIRQDGVILTNAHVVGGASEVEVQLADGKEITGRVVGRDRGVDVAVVKIARSGLPVAPLADSDRLEVGQVAVAIGNPLGYLDRTVTTGVVSAVSRRRGGDDPNPEGFIQTDAAINPGNSGGPLLDSDGRVIGLNSWIISGSGGLGGTGLGFAVPINVAKNVADQLLTTGRVERALLGVSYNDLDPEMAAAFKLPVGRGVVVEEAPEGGPAGEAGIRKGDIITGLDDAPVRTGGDLRRALRSRRPGESVRVTLQRGEQTRTVTARLTPVPTPAPRRSR